MLRIQNAELSKRYLPRRSQRLRNQKKKVLTTYVRQVPSVLDNLPMHVIQYHIFPYLDYNTRINLNMCLPAWDRIRTRMPPESIKRHHLNCCIQVVGSIISSFEYNQEGRFVYEGDKRIQRLIQMFNLFLKDDYFEIYENYENFRVTFIGKLDEMQAIFENHDPNQDPLYSRVWIDEILSTCHLLRNKILIYNQAVKNLLVPVAPPLKFI